MEQSDLQVIHGLRLRSDVPIPGAADQGEGEEISVCVGSPEAELRRPDGELIAALDTPASRYSVTNSAGATHILFDETACFEHEGAKISATAATGREATLPLLLAGIVPAMILGQRGVPVLHSAAVLVGDRLVCIGGPAGAGKSTVAALLCEAGGRLHAEDTLRVGERDSAIVAYSGTRQLRLRRNAGALAARLDPSATETSDGRVSALPEPTSAEVEEVKVMIFPAWGGEGTRISASRVAPFDATPHVLAAQRVAGWRSAVALRANFEMCTRIALDVPCFRLTLPRGDLADPALAGGVVAALESAGALRA